MPLKTDFIDLSRTYLPLDPEDYPANLPQNLTRESEERTPIFPYEGFNILPLATGYTSFFGANRFIGEDPLVDKVDEVFVYRNEQGDNILIALANDGIHSQFGDGSTPVGSLQGNDLEVADYGTD